MNPAQNPLTALVLVLEAARDRLLALHQQREQAVADRINALECETTARAMGRLLDHDLGQAQTHLVVAKTFINEVTDRCTATHGPAEVEDSLIRARYNAQRALDHLHLITEAHADGIALDWEHQDKWAWQARLPWAPPPASDAGWAVADTSVPSRGPDLTARLCVRCRGYLRPDAPADAEYCSPVCERNAADDAPTKSCALCRTPIQPGDFRLVHRGGLFCSPACADEADALCEPGQSDDCDPRHELSDRQVEALRDAARTYTADQAVDLDDVPF